MLAFLPCASWDESSEILQCAIFQEDDSYLAKEGDGLLVQSLRVTDVASDNTLEWKLGSFSEFLSDQMEVKVSMLSKQKKIIRPVSCWGGRSASSDRKDNGSIPGERRRILLIHCCRVSFPLMDHRYVLPEVLTVAWIDRISFGRLSLLIRHRGKKKKYIATNDIAAYWTDKKALAMV